MITHSVTRSQLAELIYVIELDIAALRFAVIERHRWLYPYELKCLFQLGTVMETGKQGEDSCSSSPALRCAALPTSRMPVLQ